MSNQLRQIQLDAPDISGQEKFYLDKAISSSYVSTAGPFVPEFEKSFRTYIGAKAAVSTQSGTAALHMALHELGIGQGDEVIVPVLTFIATVNPIKYVGATPVFVDVDVRTWNIDPARIEENITKKTKAIIPVHLYGNPCNVDEIIKIAEKYNLFIIEDATESLGAKYKGAHTGTLGNLGCFSFNGNKTITAGGGGMVAGSGEDRLGHIRFLINQAKDESNEHYHPEIGFNYRMTNISAALGLAQLERLDEFLVKKKEFNNIYKEGLKSIKFIRFQEEHKDAESSWWFSCIFFEKDIDISALQRELKKKQIPTRRIFMPIVEFPPYAGYKKDKYRNSYHIYSRSLCLPSSVINSEDDVCYVGEVLKRLVKKMPKPVNLRGCI